MPRPIAARTSASSRVCVKLFTVFFFAAAFGDECRRGINKHAGCHELALVDGDVDMISSNLNSVYWIENIDGLGTFSTQHIVDNNTSSYYGSYASIINDDDLIDVIITSLDENKIAWYENGVLGIEDHTENNFTLYPNPTKGKLQFQTNQEISLIEVYNLVGQKVFETKTEIDLTNLRSGIYFVKAKDSNGFSETHKVIKE